MKIEWGSHFRSDGTRRKPPPSVMHGWLAKMRGTILGNEDLRSKGMKEMREARYYKKVKSQRRTTPQRRDTGSSALFGTLNPKPARPVGRGTPIRSTSAQRVVGHPPPPPRRSSHNSNYTSGSRRHTPAPTPQRRHTPQRRQSGR
ncbi:hypothetical protein C8F01DRAFT_1118299 [Mycena amicta]|nr:hypothetical protein C8F01DRAFT_1118299 [Mycena amicta]